MNKFHLNKILLRLTFIEIALSANNLMQFLCFSQFQTENKLIIYRPAHNFWPIDWIFMGLSQVICFINLYKFQSFKQISNHSDISNGFYRLISENTFWSVNYQHDVLKIWIFVKIFSAIRATCRYNFIKIAIIVFELLSFFCF